MAKRSFRARDVERPGYPRLRDLDSGALRRWGLATIGGLLIGGVACKHEPPPPPPMAGVIPAPRDIATRLDAGEPEPTPLPPPGEPPAERIQPQTDPEAKGIGHKVKTGHKHARQDVVPPRLQKK